jgi:hypothetical protein
MIDPSITAIDRQARDANLFMKDILAEAEVSPVTWFRWRRKGMTPKLQTLRKVEAALAKCIAAKPHEAT